MAVCNLYIIAIDGIKTRAPFVHKMRGTFIEREANMARKASIPSKISHCVRTDSETLLFTVVSKPRAIRSAREPRPIKQEASPVQKRARGGKFFDKYKL